MARRHQLTEADREERRQADRERLEEAARALLSSDGWQRWVRVRAMNGLSRYSVVISGRDCRRRSRAGLGRRRHVVDSYLWAASGSGRSMALCFLDLAA